MEATGNGGTAGRRERTDFRLDTRPLMVAAGLMGLGGLLGLAGAAVGGAALAAAMREWARAQEVPPGEAARRNWERAKAATAAGATAWRNGAAESVSRRR